MTRTKLLKRLVAVSPPVIESRAWPGPRCVLATRLGLDVLARFGCEAQAIPVVVDIANTAYFTWCDEGGPGGDVEYLARGCWLVSNDPDVRRFVAGRPFLTSHNPVPPTRSPWNGHLVIAAHGQLVDLDAQQFARPAKNIQAPPALAVAWDGAAATSIYPWGAICYRTWPAAYPLADYRTAPDWTRDLSDDDAVDQMVRLIRRGE